MKRSSRFLKSGLLGAITALSFAPFNIYLIFLITFALLFAKIYQGEKSPIAEVFSFFFGLHVACLYWLVYPLTINLASHGVLIPLAIILIPAGLSAILSVPVCAMKYFPAKRALSPSYASPFVFALSLTFAMWFNGEIFPRFPWILPGYIWSCHEIFQMLNVCGIYGLSFLTLLMSGFFGLCLCCQVSDDSIKHRWPAAIARFLGISSRNHGLDNRKKSICAAIILVLLYLPMKLFGVYRLANHKTEFTNVKVRVVQGNISQKNKNNPYFAFSNLKEHLSRSEHETQTDFIIWPEASVPYLYRQEFYELGERLKSFLRPGEHLLAGAVRKDSTTGKIHNSVIVLDHRGKNVANHDKFRLLPFGEYIPCRKYVPFQSIASDIGDFDAGEGGTIVEVNGLRIIFAICYEIAFSNDFSTGNFSGKRRGRCDQADVIINVTNDGWFGFTTEPFQHLQISRARAIETGLPLIRATNYGISAVFDPCGRELARIPLGRAGIMEINIPKKIRR